MGRRREIVQGGLGALWGVWLLGPPAPPPLLTTERRGGGGGGGAQQGVSAPPSGGQRRALGRRRGSDDPGLRPARDLHRTRDIGRAVSPQSSSNVRPC